MIRPHDNETGTGRIAFESPTANLFGRTYAHVSNDLLTKNQEVRCDPLALHQEVGPLWYRRCSMETRFHMRYASGAVD